MKHEQAAIMIIGFILIAVALTSTVFIGTKPLTFGLSMLGGFIVGKSFRW